MKKTDVQSLKNKIIDIHSHAGLSFKSYYCGEYPCAETIESLYYKQKAAGVDINAVFPFGPESFCDLKHLIKTGVFKKGRRTGYPIPYEMENRHLFREIFEFCPELSDHFLPFVAFDPGRCQKKQLQSLDRLSSEFPVNGIKVVPVLCQSKALKMLGFRDIFDFAAEKNIPFLFHTTSSPDEGYSYAGDILKIVGKYDYVRFCLAHCIGFHKGFLREADAAENAWVDTSALKIQSELAFENNPITATGNSKYNADYSDHKKVLQKLVDEFPDTILWGTDSPAYSYIVHRKNADGSFYNFKLKGSYLEEKAALDSLPKHQILRITNTNTIRFLNG